MEQPSKKSRTGAGAAIEKVSEDLLPLVLDYAMSHGLVYADKDQAGDPSRATQCPIALLPLQVPARAFAEVVSLSPLWNRLVDAVARDTEWLHGTLANAAQADPFTRRLVDMSRALHAPPGLRQRTFLGIHRSDYMLHEPEGTGPSDARFLQVELNTIASSFGALASKTADLHSFLLHRCGVCSDDASVALREKFNFRESSELQGRLPANETLRQIPRALATAHVVYGAPGAVVVFIVQGDERNFADQRFLEFALWQDHGVAVLRKTLREMHDEGTVDAASGRLRLSGGPEVSVVYFRAGYSPGDYPSEAEWAGRLLIERSLAIKCPSVDYQLVGAKKVQQALARPGVVERFVGPSASAKLRACFAGLWGLGPGEGDADIVGEALGAPQRYVMKPQREGGGNNFYGDDIPAKLGALSVEERGAYIMMQRIMPRPQDAVLTRAGTFSVLPTVSEFGFYSVFVGSGEQVHLSEHAGHLVRTKAEGVDEGGVAAGYAVVNSPFLV